MEIAKETKRSWERIFLMRKCLATGARYVLMLENGMLAADGWLQRSLAALEDIEHHIDSRKSKAFITKPC